jgi:hypothetical protein
MKTRMEDWDEDILDLEDYEAEWALQQAAIDAIRRARQFGTDYVIWEDGAVKSLKPHETEPYERAALQNLERIEQKIAELKARQTSAPLLFHEQPPKPTP